MKLFPADLSCVTDTGRSSIQLYMQVTFQFQ